MMIAARVKSYLMLGFCVLLIVAGLGLPAVAFAWRTPAPSGGDDLYDRARAGLPDAAADVRHEGQNEMGGWLSFTLTVNGKPARHLTYYQSVGPRFVSYQTTRAD